MYLLSHILSEFSNFIAAGLHLGIVPRRQGHYTYVLSQNKGAQTKLCEEISNISTDNPTMDDLNGSPYMDAVVRKAM